MATASALVATATAENPRTHQKDPGGTIDAMVLAEIFGPDVLVVIVLAVVLLFGADRLPKLIRSFGEASKELKAGRDDDDAPAGEGGHADGETITLTKAELDALLDEREAKARDEAP